MNEATLQKEQVDLLALAVPHFSAIGVDECKHYLRTENRGSIPDVLRTGFVLPSAIPLRAAPVEMVGYPIEETDCLLWLDRMEQFAKDFFGKRIALRGAFPIPARLPWKNILPIFDPGLTNREMVDKALSGNKLAVWEGTNVDRFSGASALPAPRLYLIERAPRPTEATMGLPPRFARNWFAGRQTRPLPLRTYGIGTSLWYKVEKKFLDPQTATFFTENTLPGGCVACGRYFSGSRLVYFGADGAGYERDEYGFREAIVLNLNT